jgi:hypothetical protein
VLQVLPLSNGAGYGFLGVAAGTASIVVTVKGQTVQTIPATVLPPPASSLPADIDAGALLAFQSSDEAAQNPQPPMPEASGPDVDAIDAESVDAGPTDATLVEATAVDASDDASSTVATPDSPTDEPPDAVDASNDR